MTPEQRNDLINTLAWICGKGEEVFAQLSDEELQDRYNRMIEVEIDGRF